jgi:elongation factor 3
MRSISEGKIEGFPTKDELRTCFVEHKEGDERDMSIMEYIRLSLKENGNEDISVKEIVETLKGVGFEGERAEMNIGQLSGGWKMKPGLAEAPLRQAQVLLLDEPTNHLGVGDVKWLQDCLKSHTEITSLIVCHDSMFFGCGLYGTLFTTRKIITTRKRSWYITRTISPSMFAPFPFAI